MDEAIACWKTSAGLAPNDRSVPYRLGQALVRLGKAEEAKPYLDRVEPLRVREVNLIAALDRLVRGERSVEVLERLGDLCREAGRTGEARGWFQEVIRLDPTNTKAQVAVAELASCRRSPAPGLPGCAPRPSSVATGDGRRDAGAESVPVRGRREALPASTSSTTARRRATCSWATPWAAASA